MITSYGSIKLYNRWGFLQCSHELGKYLRKLRYNLTNKCQKLQRPSNDEHITIISPHDNIDLIPYNDRNGDLIKFTVDLDPRTNGNAVWLPVYSIGIGKFRLSLGLDEFPGVPLHFCVGYHREGKNYDSYSK